MRPHHPRFRPGHRDIQTTGSYYLGRDAVVLWRIVRRRTDYLRKGDGSGAAQRITGKVLLVWTVVLAASP